MRDPHRFNPGTQVSLEQLLSNRFRAKGLGLQPRKLSQSEGAGLYQSKMKGRGMLFEEVRGYQPGDDIRMMDWKVTARSNRPHIKVYSEERERPVFVLLDLHGQMAFGSQVQYKSVMAAHMASLIAWGAVAQGDKLGGVILSDDGEIQIRPRARRTGLMAMLQQIVTITNQTKMTPYSGSRLEKGLSLLHLLARPGSLCFVISDFSKPIEQYKKELSRLHRHNEVVLCMVSDPLERQAPKSGVYPITNGDAVMSIDLRDARHRKLYEKIFQDRIAALSHMALGYGMPMFHCSTHQAPHEALMSLLERR